MAAAQRWMWPMCWIRSASVQRPQVGTGVAGSAPAMTAANRAISSSARSQHRWWEWIPGLGVSLAHGADAGVPRGAERPAPGQEPERPGGGGSSARPLVRYALTPRSGDRGAPMAGCRDHLPPVPVGPARLGGGAGGERLQTAPSYSL